MAFDVSAFRLQPDGTVLQQLQGADGGAIVEGVPRLAQRFCINLMTPIGSVPYDARQGTSFVPRLQAGQARTESDVLACFAAAMPTLGPNMAKEESSADPPEERFQSAVITQIAIGSGKVTMTVRVTNQAGTKVSLTLPLEFVI